MGITDRIVESYQGAYNKIKLKDNNKKIKLDNLSDEDIITYLKKMKDFINTDFTQLLDKDKDHDLYALRDEMLENIDMALYLFEFE